MKRAIAAVAALGAVAAVLGTSTPAAHAAAVCTVTGKTPLIASGFLASRFAVNCTDDQTWTVDATVQALVNGTWERAQNTNVATVTFHGDATVTAPVDTGAWACASGRSYRTHAVYRNGSGGQTDNSTAIVLC